MSITKYNKTGNKFKVSISEDSQFISLTKLYSDYGNKVHKMKMFYINKKSRYGEHAVVYTDDYLVDIPQHMTEIFKQIYNDDEIIDDINNGRVGFSVVPYTKNHKQCYSIEFVDIF